MMTVPRASTHISSSLAHREHSHRRTALLGIAALLVLSTSPVFGHHLTGSATGLLPDGDHVWSLCLVALHMLLAPVHGVFHVLLIVGFAYATWDRLRAWRGLRGTLAALDWRVATPGDGFFEAAMAAGVAPQRVRVVIGLPSPAFAAGWVRPSIYTAADLVRRLAPAELAAVLAHEGAHVARRDPLRLSLLRFLGCVLFWLPALRRLAADLADEAEIEADDRAATQHPLVLASAILALAAGRHGTGQTPATVGFHSPELLERRIHRLAGDDAQPRSHVTRRSLAAAAAALMAVWISGLVMAHPLPAATLTHPADHCEHHRSSALSHLFCLHAAPTTSGGAVPCPHAQRA